jgi:hypothetical protein
MNELIKSGYKLSSLGTLLVGSIGTIVGALGALIGVAGGAAAAFTALIGTMMSLKIGMSVAKFALNGVAQAVGAATQQQTGYNDALAEAKKQLKELKFEAEAAALAQEGAAMSLEKAIENLNMTADLPPNSTARRAAVLAYKEADLAYRRAQERNKEAQKEAKKTLGELAKGSKQDPFAGLTKSQAKFARFLVTLQPMFKKLRESVAKGFLGPLQKGMESFIKSGTFKELKSGITDVGKALGEATKPLFKFLKSKKAADDLRVIFEMISNVITLFGPIITEALSAFMKIMGASKGITESFVGFILEKLKEFNSLLDETDAKGEGGGGLGKFFTQAGVLAGKFGKIIGNVMKGIGGLIGANFEEGSGGDMLLDWLIEASDGFANIGKDKSLQTYFQKIAVNFQAMFSGLGGIIGELIKLGADENIGIFFTKIKEATPSIGEMLGKFTPVLPTLADLAVALVDILNALADTEAPKLFFETLTKAAEAIVPLLENDMVQGVLSITGQVHALGLAFGSIKSIFEQVFGFIIGNFIAIGDTIDKVYKSKANIERLAGDVKKAYGKMKEVATAFYDQAKIGFKLYKDQAKAAFDKAKELAKTFYTQAKDGLNLYKEQAKTAFNSAKESAKTMFNVAKDGFKQMIDKAKESAIAIGTNLKGAFTKGATAAKTFATNVFLGTKAMALQAIQGAKNIAMMIWNRIVTIGAAIAQGILRVATLIGTGIQAAFNFVLAMNPLTLIIIAIVALVAALVWFFTQTELGKQIWQGFMDFLVALWNGIVDVVMVVVDWIVQAWNGLVEGVMFVFDLIVQGIQLYIDIWIAIITTAINIIVAVFQTIVGFILGIWDAVVGGIATAIDWVVGMFIGAWEGVVGFFKGFVNGLIGMFEGFVNFVIDGLNNFLGPMRDAINGVLKTLGIPLQFTAIGRVSLPRLAKGGIVMPSPGGSIVNIAEAGKPEKVVPLDSEGLSAGERKVLEALGAGGAGISIEINGAEMDKAELAAEVARRIAFQMRKGAI